MAQYTVELRELVENNTVIFDFVYPLHDPLHKVDLEAKIINHYYFREIGAETVGRFKHNLKTKLNEIMPTMNKLYSAHALPYDILSNVKTSDVTDEVINETQAGAKDVTSTEVVDRDETNTNVVDKDRTNTNVVDKDTTANNTNTVDGESTNSITDTKTGSKKLSDMPQGRINFAGDNTNFISGLEENAESVERTNPATQDIITTDEGVGTEDTSTTDTEAEDTTTTDTGTEDVTTARTDEETNSNSVDKTGNKTGAIAGYTGITPIELLGVYKENLIDIDNLIIAELNECFMRVY